MKYKGQPTRSRLYGIGVLAVAVAARAYADGPSVVYTYDQAGNLKSVTGVSTDVNNCGAVGHVCPGVTNGRAICNGGVCGLACNSGYSLCNNSCVTPASFTSDPLNCGACGATCPGTANGYATCSNGSCRSTCSAGYTACVNVCGYVSCGNVCVNTSADVINCGACGKVCTPPPNGRAICTGGACSVVCDPGYAQCGSICEIPVTCAGHCGSLGDGCGGTLTCPACATGYTCTNNQCVAPPSCPIGRSDCCGDGVCRTPTQCNSAGCGIDPPCFVAGTPIAMADGSLKPIEDVEAGDLVLSYEPESESLTQGTVIGAFVHSETPGLVRINGTLTTTPEHRFFVGGDWVRADRLRVGDRLLLARTVVGPDGTLSAHVEIAQLEELAGGVTTYNFEVADYHDYFAGGVLVHNIKAQP